MNELGTALAWSSVMVTLVASTALILERVAARRGPRAGSWVATASLLIIIVLTPLALCPIPAMFTWRFSGLSNRSAPAVLAGSSTPIHDPGPLNKSSAAISRPSEGVGHGGFIWQFLSRKLGDGLARGTDSIRQRNVGMPRNWCNVVLAGTMFCLVRLMVGLWGVRDCRRRSVAISDPDLHALAEDFRISLGARTGIEVRELPGMSLSSAVTVGWRHPLVLLPGEWRTWNNSERRAVLAHEVAHIVRADYAAGVAARIGLAIHFYHPLVHWIVGRLQLQQELAADAQAARLAGGQREYLLVLSRLALGMEKVRPAWPATAFLRGTGHLIRRIHVLKEQLPMKDGAMPAMGRSLTIALLVAIGLGAAALRIPSPIHGAETPPGTGKNAANLSAAMSTTSNTPTFDLTYLPSTAVGFVAIRPAAMSRLPACKPQLDKINAFVAKHFPIAMPKIETVDQATIEVSIRPRDKSKNPYGRIMFGVAMLRTIDDFDWKTAIKSFYKQIDKFDSDLVEVRFYGKVYYKKTKSSVPKLYGPESFYFPDARTVVWDYEENLRQLLSRVTVSGPDIVRTDDWRKVDRGLIALAIDNRNQRWKLDVNTDEPEDLPIAPLLQQASQWVIGVDGAGSSNLHAIARCGTNEKGQLLARTAESLLARARVAIGQAKLDPQEDDGIFTGDGMRLVNDLLKACKVSREGKAVDVIAKSELPVADFLFVLAECF
jgi:BlaR1 peptidase M56